MFLAVLLLALFAHGQSQSCIDARSQIDSQFPDCLSAFEAATFNVSQGYQVDDDATDLLCNNTSCQEAIQSYVSSCGSNMTVSGVVTQVAGKFH